MFQISIEKNRIVFDFLHEIINISNIRNLQPWSLEKKFYMSFV